MTPPGTPDVQVETLLNLSYYTEGPAMDSGGNLYVTTLSGGEIIKIDATGTAIIWAQASCPNGHVILQNGDHLVCDSQRHALSRFSARGEFVRHEVENWCAGMSVHTPNDLVVDAGGGIYFTDSIRHTGSVFYADINGNQFLVAGGLDYPNGLVLSADESRLFVAESYKNRVLCIDLKEPGIATGTAASTAATVFAKLPAHVSGRPVDNLPDGMALDGIGRVWVAHYGMGAIQVLSPAGEWLFSINTTLPLTSNLMFISQLENNCVLLVTGGYGEPGPGAVLRIRVVENMGRL